MGVVCGEISGKGGKSEEEEVEKDASPRSDGM